MIRTLYTLKLARTKLKSKRGILLTSIIVSSLLFATLIMSVIVFNGAEKSATEFVKRAGNDRYLVKVTPDIPYDKIGFTNPPSLKDIRAIKAFEKKYYEDLRDTYKKLNIEYDASSEVKALLPSSWASDKLPEEQRVEINWQSPVIEAMRTKKFEEYAKTASNKYSDLKELADKYGAAGYYLVDKPTDIPSLPGLRLIQNNKEDFGDSEIQTGNSTISDFYKNAIHNGLYNFTDQRLLGRYLLSSDTSKLKGIPVIVSAQEAVKLFGDNLGLKNEPDSASDKRAWIKEAQAKLNGQIYQACYRNSAEQALLTKIQRDYTEMKSNEKTEGYQKPSLIYDYPKTACGDITIKQDSRSSEEKQSNLKSIDNEKKLGTYEAPSHSMLTFQIVGIKYAQPYTEYSLNIDEYVKSLLTSQDETSAIDIPIQMYDALPDSLKIDSAGIKNKLIDSTTSDDFSARVIEFTSVNDARDFLNKETCPPFDTACDKKFRASPYGSNYLIIDEISKLFSRISAIAFPSALALAAIIIWFTISRIMAENRKETAVYRAMGAKRRDVTAIYIVYILLVSLRIAILSLIVGTVAAYVIDLSYGKLLTDTAVTAFGIIDGAPEFSLFTLESPQIIVIIGSIFLISIIASIQPLLRNVTRPPIRDIRDE